MKNFVYLALITALLTIQLQTNVTNAKFDNREKLHITLSSSEIILDPEILIIPTIQNSEDEFIIEKPQEIFPYITLTPTVTPTITPAPTLYIPKVPSEKSNSESNNTATKPPQIPISDPIIQIPLSDPIIETLVIPEPKKTIQPNLPISDPIIEPTKEIRLSIPISDPIIHPEVGSGENYDTTTTKESHEDINNTLKTDPQIEKEEEENNTSEITHPNESTETEQSENTQKDTLINIDGQIELQPIEEPPSESQNTIDQEILKHLEETSNSDKPIEESETLQDQPT